MANGTLRKTASKLYGVGATRPRPFLPQRQITASVLLQICDFHREHRQKRPHWLRAGKALVTAAESGQSSDVERAYEAIVAALDEEGWLSLAEKPVENVIQRRQQTIVG
jgi:hypothetical protein